MANDFIRVKFSTHLQIILITLHNRQGGAESACTFSNFVTFPNSLWPFRKSKQNWFFTVFWGELEGMFYSFSNTKRNIEIIAWIWFWFSKIRSPHIQRCLCFKRFRFTLDPSTLSLNMFRFFWSLASNKNLCSVISL